MNRDLSGLTKLQVWMLAARPKTLPAAAASVILGSSLAFKDGKFVLIPALASGLISLLLQIGANFANDLFDFQRGADTKHRMGPTRVTQSGLLTPRELTIGMVVVFSLSTLLGSYLTWITGWEVMLVGVAAILAAIAYTGGPFPYGYHSLGDLFVLIFFGFAAVCGTYYVQAKVLGFTVINAGLAMGLLITNILVVNNLRDIVTDREAGKITLAVRWGVTGSRMEYLACLLVAYIIPIILYLHDNSFAGSFLAWLTVPNAIKIIQEVFTLEGFPLNRTLASTAQLALIYAILFSIGIIFIH